MTRYVAIPHFYDIAHSKVTGEYYVVDNKGVWYGDYTYKKDAEKRKKQLDDALEWTGHQGPRVRALAEQETMDRLNRYA